MSEREVCKHGQLEGAGCVECQRESAQLYGKIEFQPSVGHEPVGDARAQLWARVYAAEYEVTRRDQRDQRDRQLLMRDGVITIGEYAQNQARHAADAAVRDFDEHYLGGKR